MALVSAQIDVLLDYFAGVSPTAPTTLYIDLLDAGKSSILTTIAGSANRPTLTLGATSTDGIDRWKPSDTEIVFTLSAGLGSSYQYVAVYDAITGGTQLTEESFPPTAITSGQKVSIAAGSYKLKFNLPTP